MREELLRIADSLDDAASDCYYPRTITDFAEELRALAAQCGGPVGRLTVEHFRGVRSMENIDFEYTGSLEPGTYHVYTAPPSQPVACSARGGTGDVYAEKSVAREYIRNELRKDMAPFYRALGIKTSGNESEARLTAPPVALPDVQEVVAEMLAVAPTCENDWNTQLREWAARLAAAPAGEGPSTDFSRIGSKSVGGEVPRG